MAEGAVIRPVDKGFRIKQVFIVPQWAMFLHHTSQRLLSICLISVLYMDYEHVIQIIGRC